MNINGVDVQALMIEIRAVTGWTDRAVYEVAMRRWLEDPGLSVVDVFRQMLEEAKRGELEASAGVVDDEASLEG